MARKDDIFRSFMEHPIVHEKWEQQSEPIPETVRDGLRSNVPLVMSIALLVEELEADDAISDKTLFTKLTAQLNGVL